MCDIREGSWNRGMCCFLQGPYIRDHSNTQIAVFHTSPLWLQKSSICYVRNLIIKVSLHDHVHAKLFIGSQTIIKRQKREDWGINALSLPQNFLPGKVKKYMLTVRKWYMVRNEALCYSEFPRTVTQQKVLNTWENVPIAIHLFM